ncbi:MAG: hypothetical protein AVDCRST_MAG59-1931 [uncultured Thermomicrobiales bacterium]|uniref:Uncharacterized protein n=1 Tax=uncultured Thermomicrobiales bacterium TaxID=1645740 RepID=A0A6J4UM32_9BACT|nr:MAG: hypothetical protein AVDCRST_MAG59-1931 [uncultured Thermomicrobiales bacterium]
MGTGVSVSGQVVSGADQVRLPASAGVGAALTAPTPACGRPAACPSAPPARGAGP